MAAFIKLEDSPMFQKQIYSMEQTADELKDRCQKLYKGSKKFMGALEEARNGDTTFSESLEAFGGGLDDPISVSVGGPVLSKFVTAFQELATYKELLRTQVEHVLVDRLMHFMTVDLQEAKESRRRFDKVIHGYDQAREKFVSLKKNTREDIVAELEEDLQNSKSAFEKSRFNLVNSLMNIEAKKKYAFLESISAIMDAHLRYFKLGYDLFSQMEPYIHQVLTYAQQSKEQATVEQDKLHRRIQEYRTQAELDSIRASNNIEPPAAADGNRPFGLASYKNIEAIMQSSANGKVQTIKQGYLLKRSSSLRGDWKRRFFVLNSHGALFYYRIKGTKPMGGSQSHHFTRSPEHHSGVFGRFRSRNRAVASLNENVLGCRTVDLRTSTIKMDAEDTDLRLCFRIISPLKTYTLQAENEADRIDWTNKITGAIASLLNFQLLDQPYPGSVDIESCNSSLGTDDMRRVKSTESLGNTIKLDRVDSVSSILRRIPGNDLCVECSAPEPDWASLNLGILLCIECSGVHRNLGVHISKVRSLTLDVKVWEPTLVDYFRNLGNAYCNSIWEGTLLLENEKLDGSKGMRASILKPGPKDTIQHKEIYIQAKYVEKVMVIRDVAVSGMPVHAADIWEAVKTGNLQEVYRIIMMSDVNIVDTTFENVVTHDLYHHADAKHSESDLNTMEMKQYDPVACERIKESNEPGNCLQGCSLLHLACHSGNPMMVELLLQFGASMNLRDFHGRTPLHHCIASGNNSLAKSLLRRGARPSIQDGGGHSALERAMGFQQIASSFMAAPARAFVFSRVADLSLKPSQPPPPISRHLLVRPLLPSSFPRRRVSAGSTSSVRCLISGVDGGGVSDEFVSTRKSGFDRGFSVISNMLKKIEPLDTSVISKGVSDSARDSMKQTISTMLGLLPSEQFSVTVRVCKAPLHRLLASSIITGYTLWNAEYRISLMRNFDISTENSVPLDRSEMDGVSDRVESEERDGGNGIGVSSELLDSATPQVFGDLPPEALNYIQTLQSELTNVKEELKAEKQENMQLEYDRGPRNDLLEYLRSLDSNMVTELSRPSSLEVQEIIHQLVQNILQRFFKDGTSSEFVEDLETGDKEISLDADGELETIGTSRDYLAKLLFWCMLLGHHLRGLENRLHLSCVVGLL